MGNNANNRYNDPCAWSAQGFFMRLAAYPIRLFRYPTELFAKISFECNVLLEGVEGNQYSSDFMAKKADGSTIIRECVWRFNLNKPSYAKLLDISRNYWLSHGIEDWGIVIEKEKGVIMPDFQERGAHDYRKDACLTLEEFERIVVRCIVYYNAERVISDYPYTKEMIREQVRPYACDIWNWKVQEPGTNLIAATEKEIVLTLLPRTEGKFSRYGLIVNKLRYYRDGYKEEYLRGGSCVVAYNPDDVSHVWRRTDNGSLCRSLLSLKLMTSPEKPSSRFVPTAAADLVRA